MRLVILQFTMIAHDKTAAAHAWVKFFAWAWVNLVDEAARMTVRADNFATFPVLDLNPPKNPDTHDA